MKKGNDVKSIFGMMEAEKINIYGAGLMGRALYRCLSEAPYNKEVASFVVRSMEDNPPDIDGIPVIDICKAGNMRDGLLLVALHEKHMKKAVDDLKAAGFTNVIPVSFDCDLWTDIREHWMLRHQMTEGVRLKSLEDSLKKSFSVYVVHSDADKEPTENQPEQWFEIPIWAGAALSEGHQYEVRDDIGDNISRKNRQYCELTVLYWIWKNDCSDYAGLSHYRRRFQLSESEIEKIVSSDIDVIVTVPVINFNTVRGQYEIDHDIRDWDVMLDAIGTLYPEYFATADRIQRGNCYYGYNMFIAKKEVFDGYCEWLFDILDYCERRIGKKDNSYQERYAGFLAERLLTIYFTYNQQYKLAVAKKHFIEKRW